MRYTIEMLKYMHIWIFWICEVTVHLHKIVQAAKVKKVAVFGIFPNHNKSYNFPEDSEAKFQTTLELQAWERVRFRPKNHFSQSKYKIW